MLRHFFWLSAVRRDPAPLKRPFVLSEAKPGVQTHRYHELSRQPSRRCGSPCAEVVLELSTKDSTDIQFLNIW